MCYKSVCVCVLSAAMLQQQWEALALRLKQTQEQIRAREAALVFAFVEVKAHDPHLGPVEMWIIFKAAKIKLDVKCL